MKKTEKKLKYTLIYVSICDCGNDFHAYHFTTLKGARKGLRTCWYDAKSEFVEGSYEHMKESDEFAIWDKNNQGNQITANIVPYNDKFNIC